MTITEFQKNFEKLLADEAEEQAEWLVDNFFNNCQENEEKINEAKDAYLQLGLLKKAIKADNFLLKHKPNSPVLLYETAKLYYQIDDYANYEKFMRKAISLAPSNILFYEDVIPYFKEQNRIESLKKLLLFGKKKTLMIKDLLT